MYAGQLVLGPDDRFVAAPGEGGGSHVGDQAIGDHGGSWLDVVLQKAAQRFGLRVRDALHADTTEAALTLLDRDHDEGLLALLSPASQAGLLAADVGFVHLDGPLETVAAGSDTHGTQAVQHRPRRLIRAD